MNHSSYAESRVLLHCCITLFLSVVFFFPSSDLFGQCQDPDSYDIPNPLDDPKCDVTSGDCTSKDLEIVGAFLEIGGGGCNSCDQGDTVTANLYLTIINNTGSTRTSFAIFGTLRTTEPDNTTTSCPISAG